MTHLMLLVVCGLWFVTNAQAQVIATGTMPVTEGTEYVVAFMNVSPSSTEKPLPNPLQIFISSRDKCKIQVRATDSPAPSLIREYTIEADKVLRVPIPSPSYLTTEHGEVVGGGIRVTSSAPISVSSSIQWGGNGELMRLYPVSSWGTDYRTFNLYQDRYGINSLYQYEPAQTLLIAAHDSTVAEIKTRYPLQYRGPNIDSIGHLTYRVKLNAYQRVLLRWHINENLNKEWSSDPTGTHITSNKPIGVLSGHTKGAIMRMPDHLPPTGQWAAPASFVRNCIQDAMLPVSTAGTEFVTVPAMYFFRTTGNDNSGLGIDDDRGDAIRFVATQNNTSLWRKGQEGDGEVKVAVLSEGDVFTNSAVENAVLWRADKPVMCMQYGKSWAKVLTLAADGEDQTQAMPTVESGLPMMQAVPPVNRWISSGTFYSSEGMDNFLNVVCRAVDADKITLDRMVLTGQYGNDWRPISGTAYGYFRLSIGAGDHIIRTNAPGAKFMAWTYGSLDGLQQGRAYGTPVSVDLSEQCTDTIVTTTAQNCEIYETSVAVRSGAGKCGRVHTIYALSTSNMVLEQEALLGASTTTYTVRAVDVAQSGSAVVRVMSASGSYTDLKHEYQAGTFTVEPMKIDFGAVEQNVSRCTTIVIRNTSTTDTLRLSDIGVMSHPSVFSLQPTTAVIPPNGTINVEVCAVTNTSRELLDSLVLDLGCYTMRTTEFRIKGGEPAIYVADQTWVNVCQGPGVMKFFEVVNGGDADLVVTGMHPLSDSAGHFVVLVDSADFPFTIRPGAKQTFEALFRPLGLTVFELGHDVIVSSNANGVDSIGKLRASCKATSVDDVSDDSLQIIANPQPYRLSSGLPLTLTIPEEISSIALYDLSGRKLASSLTPSIDPAAFTGPGLYIIHVITNSGSVTLPVFCIE